MWLGKGTRTNTRTLYFGKRPAVVATRPSGALSQAEGDTITGVVGSLTQLGSNIAQAYADGATGGARYTAEAQANAAAQAERDRLLDILASQGAGGYDPSKNLQGFTGPVPPPATSSGNGMSTTATVGIGVGVLGVLGLGAYALSRKGR